MPITWPIIVSATGPDALPATQEEVDERRQARLDKKAATISKKRKRASVTEGLTNIQKLGSALERKLIKFVITPDKAVAAAGWSDAPVGLHVVLPGIKGHTAYIFKIKDRLKLAGYQWNPDMKLWWAHAPDGVDDETFE